MKRSPTVDEQNSAPVDIANHLHVLGWNGAWIGRWIGLQSVCRAFWVLALPWGLYKWFGWGRGV